jgi:hypothetical protein
VDEERVEMVERDGTVVRSVLHSSCCYLMVRLTREFCADIPYVNAVRVGRSVIV